DLSISWPRRYPSCRTGDCNSGPYPRLGPLRDSRTNLTGVARVRCDPVRRTRLERCGGSQSPGRLRRVAVQERALATRHQQIDETLNASSSILRGWVATSDSRAYIWS